MTSPRSARSPAVVRLDEADEADAIAALTAAFLDNPLNVAVIGDDAARRLRCNRAGMRSLVPNLRRRATALIARAPAGIGVLLAHPPHVYPLSPPPLRDQLRALLAQGPRVTLRWQRAFEHMHREHLQAPHWYLATLGVDPPAQGQGLGSALLAGLLHRADADCLPVWLETDRAANLPFYERAGFDCVRETRIFDIPIWHMHRPERSSQAP
jgi:GNAT superfamily N-acetyltransferase